MSKQYTIKHFSLSLPAGPDQGNIVNLLNHLAETIETSEENMLIQDIVFHDELDSNSSSWPSFTVYYHS